MFSPVVAPANVVSPASADPNGHAGANPAGVDGAADFAALFLAQISVQAQLAADPELAELAALPNAAPADELTDEPPADAATGQPASDLAALLAATVLPATEPPPPVVAANPAADVPPAPPDSGLVAAAPAAAVPAALPATLPARPTAAQSDSSPGTGAAAAPKAVTAATGGPLDPASAKFADAAARLPATGTEPAAPANKTVTSAAEPLSSAAAPVPATSGAAGDASTPGPTANAYPTIQPAPGRAAGNAPAPTTARLDTPLGDARWTADFGQRIVWLARQDVQAAQLTINPPHLGPIEISLTLGADQASAIFSSAHAEVRTALESALPRLREMLASAGISLGDTQVNSQSQRQAGQHGQSAAGSSRWFAGAILDGSAGGTAGALLQQRAAVGLVDTFA